MTIQHTVSATDTYDEKIKAAEEKIAGIRQHLNIISASNFRIKGRKIALQLIRAAFVLLILFLVLILILTLSGEGGYGDTCLESGDCRSFLFLFSLFLILFTWGLVIINRIIKENKDVEQYDHNAEAELQNLEQLCVRWREEKRAFLIAHNVNIVKTDHVLNDTIEGKLGGDEKECPKCAEFVKSRAKICRYCGYEFD